PAVDLARRAVRVGKGAPTVLNCANEAAVTAFLAGQCRFLDISWIVETALDRFLSGSMARQECNSLDAIVAVEAEANRLTRALLEQVECQMKERTA
ncbi:MAG: 1-deoxy-D-xylulose-5-phosphate reductoisomerase, partial [Pseudomonadota bacterium]